ncbi:MAG TPA: DUF2270 domain-containing protein [Halococcus sp.]|nr:DUF2270 domain-containing protein [Halococcus sp.]
MSTSDTTDFDPEAKDEREIGREMVDQSTGLGSVAAHMYRGEMDRVTTWRQRLDETTKWAVTVIAAVLVYAFSGGASHAVLLAGIVVTAMFLGIESRRYQHYDIYRSRVRMIQENLLANALDPSQGVEHRDWRAELSEDYRNPKLKIRYREALQRRLQRVYLPMLGVLLAGWIFRITALTKGPIIEGATLGSVPGFVIMGAVSVFYLGVLAVTFWPQKRQAKEEFDETDYGEWNGD